MVEMAKWEAGAGMFGFFRLFSGANQKRSDDQKKKLAGGKTADLRELAADAETHPEILYYLAKNGDSVMRRAVASNTATPVQAATLLALDKDVDVRVALAARLVDLLPQLTPEKHSQLYAYAVQALGMLAQDEVLKIRRALSSALKDYAKAPPAVVGKLARDVEREVSEPVLRFCAALSDEDLVDILSSHPEPWVITAIAEREEVSSAVSEAVSAAEDAPSTRALLENKGAQLVEQTLQKIVLRAKNYPEWHRPIALRKELSLELAHELAGFVDKTVLEVLEQRSDFDPATRRGVVDIVRRRLDYQRQSGAGELPHEKLARFVAAGTLTPEVIHDAMIWHETDFVHLALAELSGIPLETVRRMIGAGAARPVIALCWKAGLPMRFCVELQRTAAHLRPGEIVYARGGTDYPLDPAEIKWQLEFFGVR